MKIFKISSVSRIGDRTKEYCYYFSCYRKALAYVAAQHFEELDDHGAIFSMVPDSVGEFRVDDCLKTW